MKIWGSPMIRFVSPMRHLWGFPMKGENSIPLTMISFINL